MKIQGREIGQGAAPYIIAEMSGNHNGSLDRALQIVRMAAERGAHAIKLQTYTADTMTIDLAEGDFFIADENTPWAGRSLYSLYQEAHTPWDWHAPIFELAGELGMAAFSSPFDATAVAFLEKLKVPAYKIASFENTDLPLIRAVASTGKPMIISTGMATLAEIDDAVTTARGAGCKELALLKCTSAYPASPRASNLASIPELRRLFNCEVGLSDHTLGIGAAIASVALGATIIEKHVTLSRSDGGVDSTFSLEPAELGMLVTDSHTAWEAVGKVALGPTDADRANRVFRRSVYIVRDLKRGEVLTRENLRCIRPGSGLSPKYYDSLLGHSVGKDVTRGTPMSWDLLA